MTITALFSKSSCVGIAISATLLLSGCGSDTEYNGKVFDLLGLSPSAQAAAKAEPKMPRRVGLVLPPDANRLPEPGTGEATSTAVALDTLNDPDKRRAMAAAERERLHKEYCNGNLSWKEQLKDTNSLPRSPYGQCGSLTGALSQ